MQCCYSSNVCLAVSLYVVREVCHRTAERTRGFSERDEVEYPPQELDSRADMVTDAQRPRFAGLRLPVNNDAVNNDAVNNDAVNNDAGIRPSLVIQHSRPRTPCLSPRKQHKSRSNKPTRPCPIPPPNPMYNRRSLPDPVQPRIPTARLTTSPSLQTPLTAFIPAPLVHRFDSRPGVSLVQAQSPIGERDAAPRGKCGGDILEGAGGSRSGRRTRLFFSLKKTRSTEVQAPPWRRRFRPRSKWLRRCRCGRSRRPGVGACRCVLLWRRCRLWKGLVVLRR